MDNKPSIILNILELPGGKLWDKRSAVETILFIVKYWFYREKCLVKKAPSNRNMADCKLDTKCNLANCD